MSSVCKIAGISKQSVYQYNRRKAVFDKKLMDLIKRSTLFRHQQPFTIHHLHRRQRLEEEDTFAVHLNTFVTFP